MVSPLHQRESHRTMASPLLQREKLRILLIPFFATSHIGPFVDLAFHLAAARPGVIEATVAVTPANVPVVRSALARRGHAAVEVATYAFLPVDGLPPGVENHSTARATYAWRIDAHCYRIGFCSRPFVPAVFGPETICVFCPGSNG